MHGTTNIKSIGLVRSPRKENTHLRETNTFVDSTYHY